METYFSAGLTSSLLVKFGDVRYMRGGACGSAVNLMGMLMFGRVLKPLRGNSKMCYHAQSPEAPSVYIPSWPEGLIRLAEHVPNISERRRSDLRLGNYRRYRRDQPLNEPPPPPDHQRLRHRHSRPFHPKKWLSVWRSCARVMQALVKPGW